MHLSGPVCVCVPLGWEIESYLLKHKPFSTQFLPIWVFGNKDALKTILCSKVDYASLASHVPNKTLKLSILSDSLFLVSASFVIPPLVSSATASRFMDCLCLVI